MIGVVIPAHNEAEHLAACVASVQRAAAAPALAGQKVHIVVALDHCTDDSAAIASRLGVERVDVQARNVGAARAAGAQRAMAAGAQWLAFTDADSVVAADWLVAQLKLRADAVCGTVGVDNWDAWGDAAHAMRRHYAQTYNDRDGHRHIHGANLGVSAEAYRQVGGFAPLVSSEDVALVKALMAAGMRIAWSAAPRVITSARKAFRAPDGFGATLLRVDDQARAARAAAAAC